MIASAKSTSPNREVGGSAAKVTDLTCAPTLNALEALQVGQTLRTIARDKRTPGGQRALLDRIGTQMFATARAAIAIGGGQ